VFDCPADRVAALRDYLDRRADKGELTYGLHISDHAVMTCLVASADDNQHVHFIDGGDGGYTRAATQLKARSAGARADAVAL
jgi:spermidine synthase